MTDILIESMEGIDEFVEELGSGDYIEDEIESDADSIEFIEAVNNFFIKHEYPLIAYIEWDEVRATAFVEAIIRKMGNRNEITVSLGVIYEAFGAKKKPEKDNIYYHFGNFLQENGLDWHQFEDLKKISFWEIEKCNSPKKRDEERCQKCYSIWKKLPVVRTKIIPSASKDIIESDSTNRKSVEPDIKYLKDLLS